MGFRKWARIVIAASGVGLAVMLFLQMHRRQPNAAPPAPSGNTGGADYVGQGGQQVRIRDNKESSIQGYERITHFPDGRTLTEKPKLLFDRGDRKLTVTADQGESRTAPGDDVAVTPKNITLKGHVNLTSSDGFTLTCAEASYNADTGLVDVPGATAFSRGRMSGSGQGASYDHGTDTLVLRDRAQIDTKPDPQGQGVLHTTSKSLTLARPAHTLALSEHAVIIRDGQTMQADQALVALTDDDNRVKRMELRGQSSVVQPATATGAATTMAARDIDLDFVPEENRLQMTDLRGAASVTQPPTAKSKPPQMKAETIRVEFQADGRAAKRAVMTDRALLTLMGTDGAARQVQGNRIDVALSADGQRATGLNGQGTPVVVTLPESADSPGRTIQAETLEAGGNDAAGLTSAVFKPAAADKKARVSLVETQKADPKIKRKAMKRDLHAREMDLTLNGDLGAIEDARFLGDFQFSGEGTEAVAGEGLFIETSGQLRLVSGAAPRALQPRVETDRLDVAASRIEMETKTNNLTATKDVQSHLKPDTSASAKAVTGLFDGAQKIIATAAKLVYTDEAEQAEYSGGAHVWQGNNDVIAETVTLSSHTGNLSASGGVQTVFLLDKAPGSSDVTTAGASALGAAACRVAGASCINAKAMSYDDARRVATYTSHAILMGSGGISMMADTIALTLAAEGRALNTADADGSVVANVSTDRQVQGAHLTYTAGTDHYVVQGKPLVVVRRSVDKGKESCSISTGRLVNFTPANDALKRREDYQATDVQGRTMREEPAQSCAAVIKVIK